ncbi:aliphatic sulfonate ABC transporter substrate-binding protein [Deinococcus soli (ex Cha et al. 2016)]|uniref:Sulfonate transport system substrate-binding protein n=2 Tax=Deinococcus soli (ex Cha et al. 2016) TaxID=1309411 RepID=A0ACC6KET7_9DEIO|nr:aliphatic sulfonate ABC transporter substrate-binding protein [Deinococcus soli (ex Cha et al. 2016)]MDR6217894.1 sulfonate transport system substrate-binding protein [Deinococcus soli (ex Cha et al. 2016)]MDR6328144.1 sulfonate transport system substrate-binding protein [Deinococcus soli (ex Cha et al. 2016)]MDR6750996.1 sulfonate transport system substrate-binding protein [Deinococcus soli (ex Cha et al. 2016)]
MPTRLRSAALTLTALALGTLSAAQAITFTIGYQKGGIPNILKARGTLDRYAAQGIDFRWVLFTAGPPLLEAANAGAVDFGSVGNAPGVFALAGGADLKYVGVTVNHNDTTEAVIVPKTSAVQKVSDLKGKRIGVARGSSAHAFLYSVLRSAGLSFKDVTVVPLLPPDARPAFENGSIDAWAIWDPFLTTALQGSGGRVLRDHAGLGRGDSYHLVPGRVLQNPEKKRALQILLAELESAANWANVNRQTVINQFSDELGIPKSVLSVTVPKSAPFNIRPFRASDLKPLQTLAVAFREAGVLPRDVPFGPQTYVTLPAFRAALPTLGLK